jgi:hypothetical protein
MRPEPRPSDAAAGPAEPRASRPGGAWRPPDDFLAALAELLLADVLLGLAAARDRPPQGPQKEAT